MRGLQKAHERVEQSLCPVIQTEVSASRRGQNDGIRGNVRGLMLVDSTVSIAGTPPRWRPPHLSSRFTPARALRERPIQVLLLAPAFGLGSTVAAAASFVSTVGARLCRTHGREEFIDFQPQPRALRRQ